MSYFRAIADHVQAKSRNQLLPDPEKDEVTAVFFCFQNEDDSLPDTTTHDGYHAGYVMIDSLQTHNGRAKLEDLPCHVVDSELDLINWVIDSVKAWDPDVLAGWELHNSSWGYLAERANEAFSEPLPDLGPAHCSFDRYRFHRGDLESCRREQRAEEGLLFRHAHVDVQGIWSAHS
jgi:DNA polymerase zeta